MKSILKTSLYILVAVLVGVGISYATSKLTPPGSVTNTMYSLTDIYNLASGTTATEGSGTISTTPDTIAETGKTLTEVYTAISTEIAKLTNGKIAKDQTAFGFTGTLYGDTDPSKVLTTATYPGTATAGYEYPSRPLQTFGTSNYCTNDSGNVISCTGTGQDGEYQTGTPRSYTDNGDGTVTDNATGLMWQKCSVGLSGSDCATGTATQQANWTTALATCNNLSFAGHDDWKLPNRFELESIINLQYANPAIDRTTFPNTQSSNYWSSSTYVSSQSNAWNVYFGDGSTYDGVKTDSGNLARCVRNLP